MEVIPRKMEAASGLGEDAECAFDTSRALRPLLQGAATATESDCRDARWGGGGEGDREHHRSAADHAEGDSVPR